MVYLFRVVLLCCALVGIRAITSLIVEYVSPFSMPTNDLLTLTKKQFSNITISAVKTSYANIPSWQIASNYIGDEKKQVSDHPYLKRIYNDSWSFTVKYNATITHPTLTHKNYSCTSTITPIYLNYTKQLSPSGKSTITGLKNSLSPSLIQTTCNPSFTGKDQTYLSQAITSTDGQSLYLQIRKAISGMQTLMQDNAVGQTIGKTYTQSNPYIYEYYTWKVPINVTTIGISDYKDNGIINEISGLVPNATATQYSLPPYKQSATLFYSKQFITNMVNLALNAYPGYQSIKVDGSWVRSTFKYRVIDLEFVLDGFMDDYGDVWNQNISFACGNGQVVDGVVVDVENNLINASIQWICKGIYSGKAFIEFQPEIAYSFSIRVVQNAPYDSYLVVASTPTALNALAFASSKYTVNQYLVRNFILEAFSDLRSYTPGTFFKVGKGAKQITLVEEGIWIS